MCVNHKTNTETKNTDLNTNMTRDRNTKQSLKYIDFHVFCVALFSNFIKIDLISDYLIDLDACFEIILI